MAATTAGTPVQATPPGEKVVNVSLPTNVHKHFLGQAEADFRSISQFLKLKLMRIHKEETTPAIVAGNANTTSASKLVDDGE
jgi:hypothetical protein